jgi:SPP1 family predicted phage head-tail adaptor
MFTKTGNGTRKCFKLFQTKRVEGISGSSTRENKLVASQVWASVETLSGRRLIEAEQIASGTTHKLRTGFFHEMPDQTYYFERNGKQYWVQSVTNPSLDNTEYEYLVAERTP